MLICSINRTACKEDVAVLLLQHPHLLLRCVELHVGSQTKP
jgi:hypothetical protein